MTLVEVSTQPLICSECDREFATIQGLNGHLISHRQTKVPCPDCGGEYFSGAGMGRHRASAHPVKDAKPREAKAKTVKAPDLTIDEIFDSVVGVLWPRGVVPTTAIMPLARWRDATQKMLDEIKP